MRHYVGFSQIGSHMYMYMCVCVHYLEYSISHTTVSRETLEVKIWQKLTTNQNLPNFYTSVIKSHVSVVISILVSIDNRGHALYCLWFYSTLSVYLWNRNMWQMNEMKNYISQPNSSLNKSATLSTSECWNIEQTENIFLGMCPTTCRVPTVQSITFLIATVCELYKFPISYSQGKPVPICQRIIPYTSVLMIAMNNAGIYPAAISYFQPSRLITGYRIRKNTVMLL